MRTRVVSVASLVAALAIAAPATAASAATSATPLPPLPALPALPAFTPVPLTFVGPTASVAVAIGPTVIGSVFNGGTTVCVSTVVSACSVNASP
jgi:hypothetical protein